jgi:phage protein D
VYWGEGVTPTYIAKSIAAKHKLRAVLTSSTWQLNNETQANESDFEFLTRIANKTGYRFWVGNGTLYFIDPGDYIAGSSNQGVPTYTMNKMVEAQDTCRNLSIFKGDNLPGAVQAQRSVFGIDNSGNVFQSLAANPTDAGIQQITSARVATSPYEGQQIANASQRLRQFWIGGRAELFGNSNLYPGKLVQLQGRALPDNSSGFWIVTSAVHVLKKSGLAYATADKYVTQVELVRNVDSTVQNTGTFNVIRPEFPPCQLYQGQWVSTNLNVIYDGNG